MEVQTRHMPLRRCRVCRTQAAQAAMQRWTQQNGLLVPDGTKRRPGRGYYSCSESCAGILAHKYRLKPKE